MVHERHSFGPCKHGQFFVSGSWPSHHHPKLHFPIYAKAITCSQSCAMFSIYLSEGKFPLHFPRLCSILQVLQPLVDLPLGVLMRLLHTPALPAEVQLSALSTLRDIYACRGCPFVASEDLADRYIQIHYVMFLKLYLLPQQPLADGQDPPLSARSLNLSVRSASSAGDTGSSRRARCLAHLHVLIALAGHKHKHVQQLFQRHKVLQFLAAELSLEFHAKRHGSLSHLRAHNTTSRQEVQGSTSGASQAHSQDSEASCRMMISSAQQRAQCRSGSGSNASRRPASGRRAADTLGWHGSHIAAAAEDGFQSPLASVESRQCGTSSRPVSARPVLNCRRQSRASTPTSQSQDKATARTPPARLHSGASGDLPDTQIVYSQLPATATKYIDSLEWDDVSLYSPSIIAENVICYRFHWYHPWGNPELLAAPISTPAHGAGRSSGRGLDYYRSG